VTSTPSTATVTISCPQSTVRRDASPRRSLE
jgi:hypothetical protein